MMTRKCSVCGGSKSGEAAKLKWDVPISSPVHDQFWTSTHKPDCKYVAMSPGEKVDDFMANGSPVSSIDE